MRTVALALALAIGTPAAAEPVVVTTRAVPDSASIGARVRYEIEIVAEPDVEIVVAQPTERLGVFEIVDFGVDPPTEREGRTVQTRWFEVVGFDLGHHLVEAPPVAYRTPGAEFTEVPSGETRISIEAQIDDLATASLRDIAAPEHIPLDWTRPALLAGAVATALLAAFGMWWVLRRRRRVVVDEGPPPDVVADVALDALAARQLIEQGLIKDYYADLSGIVRRYLEDRFMVRAPEMTTEEFLVETTRNASLGAVHRGLLGEFLSESDLVKFARYRPSVDDAARALDAARRFVAETRPVEAEAA